VSQPCLVCVSPAELLSVSDRRAPTSVTPAATSKTARTAWHSVQSRRTRMLNDIVSCAVPTAKVDAPVLTMVLVTVLAGHVTWSSTTQPVLSA